MGISRTFRTSEFLAALTRLPPMFRRPVSSR